MSTTLREPLVGHSPHVLGDSDAGNEMVSVIVPAKNEEQNLPILVERLFATLGQLNRPFEVITGGMPRSAGT